MKKPKSTVRRMADYFKQNPIPLTPKLNITEVRRAMKGYAKGFTINIKNDIDPLAQLQETKKAIGSFLGHLKAEMGGFKYSEALDTEFYKRIESPKPHKYEKGYCDSKQHVIINTHSIQKRLELTQREVLKKVANWLTSHPKPRVGNSRATNLARNVLISTFFRGSKSIKNRYRFCTI